MITFSFKDNLAKMGVFIAALFFILSMGFACVAQTGLSQKKEIYKVEEGDFLPPLENDIVISTDDGDRFKFEVELAVSGREQEKGLMFRENLADDAGMLFLFRGLDKRTFWMKNTLIPLDIIFLEADGTIQHIHSMAEPQSMALITSGERCKAVLELKGGVTDRLGIKKGDVVHHTYFRNLNLLAP